MPRVPPERVWSALPRRSPVRSERTLNLEYCPFASQWRNLVTKPFTRRRILWPSLAFFDGCSQPGAGVSPLPFDGADRDLERLGDFRNGHSNEVAELHDPGRQGFDPSQLFQGF